MVAIPCRTTLHGSEKSSWKVSLTHAKSCKVMQSHAKSCKVMQSHAKSCKVMQSRLCIVQSTPVLYWEISQNAKSDTQKHAKSKSDTQKHAKSCKVMQSHAKSCKVMQSRTDFACDTCKVGAWLCMTLHPRWRSRDRFVFSCVSLNAVCRLLQVQQKYSSQYWQKYLV